MINVTQYILKRALQAVNSACLGVLIGAGIGWTLLPTQALADTVKIEVGPNVNPHAPAIKIETKTSEFDDKHDNKDPDHRQRDYVNLGTNVVVAKPVDGSVVTILGDAAVNANVENSVVTILGDSTVTNAVKESVVSVFGNANTSGDVGESVVAVLGDVAVNNEVKGPVVAVLGSVTLGPQAIVHGDAVAVGGSVIHDPSAVVDQSIQSVGGFLSPNSSIAAGAKAYIKHAVLFARPLAIGEHLGWVWIVTFTILALYMLTALMLPKAVTHTTAVLKTRPGMSFVTALLSIIGIPLTILFLIGTLIGIPVVPIFILMIMAFSVFGRIVVIAAIGSSILAAIRTREFHPVFAVLVGGLIVMGLYLVPVIGYLTLHLIGFLGFGATLFAFLQKLTNSKSKVVNNHSAENSTMMNPETHPSPSSAENSNMVSPEAQSTPSGAEGAQVESLSEATVDVIEQPAGFSQRMQALLIDLVAVNILVSGTASVFGHWLWWSDNVGFPNLVPLAIYAAILWHYRGTTAGGVILKLKVERKDGLPMDLRTASIRALACFLSLFACGLGFFWILIDEKREAWHDKIAGTRVVRSTEPLSLI